MFALAHWRNLVEENPRKFLKHLTQNIRRANWTTHHTSDLVVETARTYEVDWHTTRHILHPDGKIKSGFSSSKTSTLRTYLVKSITNTLPTMSTLNSKWAMYDTSACSWCDERNETNEHIWRCEKATPAVNGIISDFHQKYRISDRMRNHTILALRGIATVDLTAKMAASIRSEQDNSISTTEAKSKVTQAYLSLIAKGRKEVWLPRNEAAIAYQKHILNISAKDKCEALQPPQPSTVPQAFSQLEEELPTVLVAPSDLNRRYDAYRCKCGQHSLLHTPGKRCDGAGLIIDRATDITTSCRHRNLEIIPLIFTTQVLSWTALRLP